MSEQEVTAREDVEALEAELRRFANDLRSNSASDMAYAVLKSDWLAAHDEGVRAAERERLAAEERA